MAQVYVASRAAIAAVGALLMLTQHWSFAQLVGRWDVLHFIDIAQNGYAEQGSPAFFPGLPLLLRAGSAIGISMPLTGVIIGLVCSGLAAAALYKLFGAPAACLWLIAPTAVFTVVGYSEAAFCAAAFWAWQRAGQNKWGQAALLAGLACTFRITGLFLLAGLAVYVLAQKIGRRPKLIHLVWLLIPVAVLGGYVLYLHQITGSWLAWWDAQQVGWGRSFASPWASLLNTIQAGHLSEWPGRPDVAWVFRAEIVSMAAGVAATVITLWRRQWAQATYVGSQVVAFGTSIWYMSVNRALLVWFPLWAIGRPKSQPGRVALGVAAGLSAAAMLVWAWLFFTGRWAS